MKSKIKQNLGLLVSAATILSMNITAFASSPTASITIDNDKAGHEYEAYQIFDGDISGNVLSNIVWGNAVSANGAALLAELQSDSTFNSCTDVEDVVDVLTGTTGAVAAKQFAKIVGNYIEDKNISPTNTSSDEGDYYLIDNIDAGYYLVMDSGDVTLGNGDAKTSYILQVLYNAEMSPKSGSPTLVKKVLEDSDLVGTDQLTDYTPADEKDKNYNDVADWNVGQTENFKLYANLPAEIWDYETYELTFHDTFCDGITVTTEDGNALTTGPVDTANFNVSYIVGGTERTLDSSTFTGELVQSVGDTDGTLTFTVDDILPVLKAKNVNSGEVTIAIEYYAELNSNAIVGGNVGNPNDAYLEYSNNPNNSGLGTSETGETEKDYAVVFTFELDGTKVDSADNTKTLLGAKFVLGRATTNPDEAGEWATIENGKISGWTSTLTEATEVESADGGKFGFVGIDSGTYYLKETVAPEGYNTPTEDTKIVVESIDDTSEDKNIYTQNKVAPPITGLTYQIGNGTQVENDTDIKVKFNALNSVGSTLPGTGDTGRIAFYAIGSIGTALCLVFLITKRRMNRAEISK